MATRKTSKSPKGEPSPSADERQRVLFHYSLHSTDPAEIAECLGLGLPLVERCIHDHLEHERNWDALGEISRQLVRLRFMLQRTNGYLGLLRDTLPTRGQRDAADGGGRNYHNAPREVAGLEALLLQIEAQLRAATLERERIGDGLPGLDPLSSGILEGADITRALEYQRNAAAD